MNFPEHSLSRHLREVTWIAPALAVLGLLSFYPLVYLLKVSLFNAHGLTLEHYARLSHDLFFYVAAAQTLIYTAVALVIEFSLGLALALLVESLSRGRAYFRATLLTPMLLPPVVAAVVWRLVYNPQFGVLNGTLRQLGINTSRLTWTSGEHSALLSVILVDVWEWTPFMFLLLSAGLQSVPQEPIEAAKVDGASNWQILRHVVLPLMKSTILMAVLLRAMDLLRIFDQIFILTRGGPGYATETVSLYIYRTAFHFFNFGYAGAMSLLGLAVTVVFAQNLIKLTSRRAAR
jgi:multiple sugar transport system permease protein